MRSVEDRFWSKVARSEPQMCWPWTRSRFSTGYGQFKVSPDTSPQKASRVAWTLANGPIPDGLVVCHRCDNPPCCNPAHLFLGTPADNVADMHDKGRQGHVDAAFVEDLVERVRHLTDAQISEARLRHLAGESCRAISRRFGVSHTTISRLIKGEHWKRLAS